MALYEKVENVLTNRLKSVVSDIAACLAVAVTMVEKQDRSGLQAFAHQELDRFISERIAEKEQDEPE
jgi:hypothetical protein